MWNLTTPWYELVLRGTIIYFFMFVAIKLWGKKHMGELTAFDFILLLFISEAVQNSLVSDDKSVFSAMIVITTFLIWNSIINKITFRSRTLEKILDGTPVILVKNGTIDKDNMWKEQVTEQELEEAMRRQGLDDLSKVKQATLETNGHLTIIER